MSCEGQDEDKAAGVSVGYDGLEVEDLIAMSTPKNSNHDRSISLQSIHSGVPVNNGTIVLIGTGDVCTRNIRCLLLKGMRQASC